jgi:large subunit ribosomal protein L10
MKRSEKEQIIAEVKKKIERAQGMYFADFLGITVSEDTELRREFRKANIDYQVVKNTLTRKALESVTGFDKVIDKLGMPTAIAFGYDDPILPAKIIKKFCEKNEKFKLKVCIIDKQVFDGSQLAQIAKLPGKKEIMASIVGSLQAPMSGIVGTLNAVMRDLVSVIDAIEKKKSAATAAA